MTFKHENHQLTLLIDEKEAGYLKYERDGDVLNLVSTVVHPEFRSNGYAALLVDEISKYARRENLKTNPVCSYIVAKYDKGGYEDIDARETK